MRPGKLNLKLVQRQMLGIVKPNLVSIEAIKKNFKDDHRDLKCDYCGWSHKRGKRNCPAYGKTCEKCGGRNHFRTVCRGPDPVMDLSLSQRCESRRRPDRVNGKNRCLHRCNVHDIDNEEDCHDDSLVDGMVWQTKSSHWFMHKIA